MKTYNIPESLKSLIQYDSEHDTFIYSELAIAIINDIFKNHMDIFTDLYDDYVDEYSSPSHQCDITFEFNPKTTLENELEKLRQQEIEELIRKQKQEHWDKVHAVYEKGPNYDEFNSIYNVVGMTRSYAHSRPYHGIEYTIGVLKPNIIHLVVKSKEMNDKLKNMLQEVYDYMESCNAKVYDEANDAYVWKFKYDIKVITDKSTTKYILKYEN